MFFYFFYLISFFFFFSFHLFLFLFFILLIYLFFCYLVILILAHFHFFFSNFLHFFSFFLIFLSFSISPSLSSLFFKPVHSTNAQKKPFQHNETFDLDFATKQDKWNLKHIVLLRVGSSCLIPDNIGRLSVFVLIFFE